LKKSIAIAALAAALSAGTANAATPSAEFPTSPAESALLPLVALDANILFKTLSAEIAIQRNQWSAAYLALLGLAQKTQDPRFAKRAAEVAINARAPADALNAVRMWSSLAPDSEDALHNYLGLLILANNTDEVGRILTERLEKAPPAARGTLILRAHRMVANLKDTKAAFALMEKITAPYANLTETHIALSQSAFLNRDNARAVSEAELALTQKPDSELAMLTLAQAMPNSEAITQRIATFLEKNPLAREVRIAYARELLEQNKNEEALAHFNILLEQDPNNHLALYALGVTQIQLQQWEAAENALRQYLNKTSLNPSENDQAPDNVRLLLSQIAEQRGDYANALQWMTLNAPTFENQLRRASLLAKSDDLTAARSVFVQLKKEQLTPLQQQQLVQAEAFILRGAQRDQEAAAVLKAGVAAFPDNTNLLYDYAMVAESLREFKEMEAALRKVIQLAPNMQHAYNALGYSFADRNIQLKEAHTLISKAFRLAPNDPFITDSMGWIEYRLGNLSAAEQHLVRAYEMRPDVEIATHLGEVLWAQQKFDAARQIWEQAQQKDPNNALLIETMTRLKAK
jgi:Flp pilus assembly protein TadD